MVALPDDPLDRTAWTPACVRTGFGTGALHLHDLLMRLPAPLQKLYDAWMAFSHVLGRVMSFILLSILWAIGFGIYSCGMRLGMLFGKEPDVNTYWKKAEPQPPEHLLRQF